MLKLHFSSYEFELQAATTKDKHPFVATVTYAGKVSDHFVGGTENIPGGPYRVVITAELLKQKIKTLEGKQVFAAEGLNSHDFSVPVGQFVSTWTELVTLPDGTSALAGKASGFLDRNKSPELVDQIIEQARAGKMGFSYDLKQVKYTLESAASTASISSIELTDFQWRGATILARDAAAYEYTQLAAAKTSRTEEPEMTKEELLDAIKTGTSDLRTSISSMQSEVSELKSSMATLKAEANKPTQQPTPQSQNSQNNPSAEPKARVTLDDLGNIIASKLKEAIEPLTAKLQAGNANQADAGKRKSIGAELELFAKWAPEKKEGEDVKLDRHYYDRVIQGIQADPSLTTQAKITALQAARACKVQHWQNELLGREVCQ